MLTLTRELRFLENEFHYVKDNQEAEILGKSLRYIGKLVLTSFLILTKYTPYAKTRKNGPFWKDSELFASFKDLGRNHVH